MSVLKKIEHIAVDVADAALNVTIAVGTIVGEAALENATGVAVHTTGNTVDISVGAKAPDKKEKK